MLHAGPLHGLMRAQPDEPESITFFEHFLQERHHYFRISLSLPSLPEHGKNSWC